MLPLPRGVTGFWSVRDCPAPSTNEQEFRAYCHTVARQLGGTVTKYEGPHDNYPRNFASTTLQVLNSSVLVLLNGHYPLMAFAKPPGRSSMFAEFVDAPELAAEFHKFDRYTLYSTSDLEQPLTPAVISNLYKAEVYEIKYWNAATLGEVVFNYWD